MKKQGIRRMNLSFVELFAIKRIYERERSGYTLFYMRFLNYNNKQ